MGQITVRKLDDELIRRLKVRAAQNGRSAEAEVREMLARMLPPPADPKIWEEIRAHREKLRKKLKGRPKIDVVATIREFRDRNRLG